MSESDEQQEQLSVDDIVRQHENDGDSDNNQLIDNVVQDAEAEEDEEKRKVDPRKRVVRKMVVLNTERLKGLKGVHTIEKLYQGFQFRGKNHEAEDLDRLMKRLEYWAFRVFPKLEFDDFLAKCEALGHKKDLHTHLKKYRLGMIDADYQGVNESAAQNDDDDDGMIEDEVDEAATAAAAARTERASIAEENFDRLLAEINNVPTEP